MNIIRYMLLRAIARPDIDLKLTRDYDLFNLSPPNLGNEVD